jgi:hypothetical protein
MRASSSSVVWAAQGGDGQKHVVEVGTLGCRECGLAPSQGHQWPGRATAVSAEPENAPANTLGIRRIMFAVKDIEDVLARLHTHGAKLIGELDQYEDSYRLCYLRGPAGIIVALAEQIR